MIEDNLLQKPLPPTHNFSEGKLWLTTSIFSIIILTLISLYIFLIERSFSLHVLSDAAADTAFILIGLSFALSSICYFWNFADSKIIYRKHLGLCGFAFALAHGAIALWFIPEFAFPNYYTTGQARFTFIFAICSLVIYAGMAIISNQYAIHKLGGNVWRLLLRIGYIAYVYTILHFGLKAYSEWLDWFSFTELTLPPSSLLMFLFGVTVILLRIAMEISHRIKKKSTLSA